MTSLSPSTREYLRRGLLSRLASPIAAPLGFFGLGAFVYAPFALAEVIVHGPPSDPADGFVTAVFGAVGLCWLLSSACWTVRLEGTDLICSVLGLTTRRIDLSRTGGVRTCRFEQSNNLDRYLELVGAEVTFSLSGLNCRRNVLLRMTNWMPRKRRAEWVAAIAPLTKRGPLADATRRS